MKTTTVYVYYGPEPGDSTLLFVWVKREGRASAEDSWFEAADGSIRIQYRHGKDYLGNIPKRFMPTLGKRPGDFVGSHMHVKLEAAQ